jgi:hypothetical protein
MVHGYCIHSIASSKLIYILLNVELILVVYHTLQCCASIVQIVLFHCIIDMLKQDNAHTNAVSVHTLKCTYLYNYIKCWISSRTLTWSKMCIVQIVTLREPGDSSNILARVIGMYVCSQGRRVTGKKCLYMTCPGLYELLIGGIWR